MNNASKTNMIDRLKSNGHRLTTARKAIITIFESQGSPISAEELDQILIKNNVNINKSTLYREIDFLIEQGFLKSIQLQEKTKRYELVHLHHHHHLICQKCKEITDFEIENCLDEILKNVSNTNHFKIDDHILDLYGICSKCSK